MCWNGPTSPFSGVRGLGDCEVDIHSQQKTIMMAKIRGLVSKNKKRFKQDGFDLDLSYIKDNIIAMGFPAAKLESVYRNHIDDVARFLETFHGNSYKIYNLCETDRTYDQGKFFNRVVSYPFDDHNPPDLTIIQPFCEDVDQWLTASEKNVAVVHCKAGKGRTGVMICCYLLHTAEFNTPEEALHFYGQKRTRDTNGVTVPSQRRYVHYYHQMLTQKSMAIETVSMLLRYFEFEEIPAFDIAGGCSPYFVVYSGKRRVYKSSVFEIKRGLKMFRMCVPSSDRIVVFGDVKVVFYHKPRKLAKKQKMFQFYFNTFFVNPVAKPERMITPLSQHHSDPTPSISTRTVEREISFSKDDSCIGRESGSQLKTDLCCSKLPPSFPFFKSSPFPNRTAHSCKESWPTQSNGHVSPIARPLFDNRSNEGDMEDKQEEADTPNGFSNWQIAATHELVLTKSELDRAVKDRHCRHFPKDFKVRMALQGINENEPIPLESDQQELIVIPPSRGPLLPLNVNLETNGKLVGNGKIKSQRQHPMVKCQPEGQGLHCRQEGFQIVEETNSCASEDNPSTGAISSCSSNASDSNSAAECPTGCDCADCRGASHCHSASSSALHSCQGCHLSLDLSKNLCRSGDSGHSSNDQPPCPKQHAKQQRLSGSRSAEPLRWDFAVLNVHVGAEKDGTSDPQKIQLSLRSSTKVPSTHPCGTAATNGEDLSKEGSDRPVAQLVKERRGTFPR